MTYFFVTFPYLFAALFSLFCPFVDLIIFSIVRLPVFSLATKEIRLICDEIIMAIFLVRPTQLIAFARHDLNKNHQNLN